MKSLKVAVVFFIIGAVCGTLGGGYMGYKIGSADNSIDRAPVATVVPVQEINRNKPKRAPQTQPAATAATEENAVAPVEAVTEAPAVTAQETVAAENQATEAVVETADETPAAATAEETDASASTETFTIHADEDSDNSVIEWVGYKSLMNQRLSMKGGFMHFDGEITVVDNAPDESYVELTIDLEQIFSENVILTKVLKGEFFFDVAHYPTAHFISSKVEPMDDGKFMVTGNLTMHDTTVGVQFPAVIERRGDKAYAAGEFAIDRTHWNIGYEKFEDFLILNEVFVSFEILADPA